MYFWSNIWLNFVPGAAQHGSGAATAGSDPSGLQWGCFSCVGGPANCHLYQDRLVSPILKACLTGVVVNWSFYSNDFMFFSIPLSICSLRPTGTVHRACCLPKTTSRRRTTASISISSSQANIYNTRTLMSRLPPAQSSIRLLSVINWRVRMKAIGEE